MSFFIILKNLWRKNSPIFKWQISGKSPKSPLVRPVDPWKGSLYKGEKSFMSHPKIISDDYWNSFEWLRDLREIANEKARIRSRNLVNEWLIQNSFWDENTWSTRLMSKRLSNILFCYGTFADTADIEFQEKLMKKFSSQARCLELDWKNVNTNVEKMYSLLGMMAGRVCLTKQKKEIDYVIETVIKEIKKVVNKDGMHVSRKPQLQLEMLKIIIEINYLGKSSLKKMREEYNEIILKISSSTKMLLHSDGSVANFNGGSIFDNNIIPQIITKSNNPAKALTRITADGFVRINSKLASVIIDIGRPNKEFQNWHAGTLSFEFSYGKNLIIVNNGFIDIDISWSNALRGTSAHSTISIDGKNSSNLEINKRERISNVNKKVVENSSRGLFVRGTHDGYFASHGIYHEREIVLNKDGNKINGKDRLIYTGAPGTLALSAEIRFHLYPELKAVKVLSGDILLRLKDGTGWLFKSKGVESILQDSIYIKENNVFKSEQILINLPLNEIRSSGIKIIEWEFYKNS